jgi:hypothetical protein
MVSRRSESLVNRVGARVLLQHLDDQIVGIKIIPFADMSDGRRIEVGEDRLQAGMGFTLYPDFVSVNEGKREGHRKGSDNVVEAVHRKKAAGWYEALVEALEEQGVHPDETKLRTHDFVVEPNGELIRALSR